MTNREKVARLIDWLLDYSYKEISAEQDRKPTLASHYRDRIEDTKNDLLTLLSEPGEPVGESWKLWDGWGPHTDGLMRVSRIGPNLGGLEAFYNHHKADIQGTREDLELVVTAVNAHLHPRREREAMEKFVHDWDYGPCDRGTENRLLEIVADHVETFRAILGEEPSDEC